MFLVPLSNVYLASDGGGEHIDPVEDEVLATTDVLRQGRYNCQITLTTTNLDQAAALCEVRHVGVDGDPVERLIIAGPVDQSWQYEVAFSLEENESIAVTPYGTGFLGTAMAAINYQKVS